MENSSQVTHAETESLFDKLDDHIITKIILILPKDIPELCLVSNRLQNIIDNDHILKKVHQFGLTPMLYTTAINDDDFECVQYAFNNGCKFTMQEHENAIIGILPPMNHGPVQGGIHQS